MPRIRLPQVTGFPALPKLPINASTMAPVRPFGKATLSGDGFEKQAPPMSRTRPFKQSPPSVSGLGAEFEERNDANTGSLVRAGNKVELLFDGTQSFAARNALIDGAKESIHLQTFIFNDDETGRDLAGRLAEKAASGVDVRVIYDELGSNRADESMFNMMREAGVDVRGYGALYEVWDLNDRWHEKHLIVDGATSIEGGMNIADEYAFGGSGRRVFTRGETGEQAWRDVDLKLQGPAVHDTQRAFMSNWRELGADVSRAKKSALYPKPVILENGAKVRVVQHRPEEDGDHNTDNLYLNAINSAQTRIRIENAYFLPPEPLREALMAAAQRGVDVQVLTNSKASNDTGFVSDAARYFMDDLVDAGVKIFERRGSTLHSKTASFDGKYSLVGSHNLNGRSSGRDSEVVLGIDQADVAKQLDTRFAEGIKQADAVTKEVLEDESFFTNLRQFAFAQFAWTF